MSVHLLPSSRKPVRDRRFPDPSARPSDGLRYWSVAGMVLLGALGAVQAARWLLAGSLVPLATAIGLTATVAGLLHSRDRAQEAAAAAGAEAGERSMIETLADGLILFDLDGEGWPKPVLMNPSAVELLGHDLQTGQDLWAARVAPGFVDTTGTPIGRDELPVAVVARTARPASDMVVGLPGPDERLRWVRSSAHPIRDGGGAMVGIVASLTDITAERSAQARAEAERIRFARLAAEARRSERARRETHEQFRSAFDHAPIGKAMISLDGRYQQVNEALCAMTGYTDTQLRGLNVAELTHPDDIDADVTALALLLAGSVTTSTIEKRYLTAAGRFLWVAQSASLVRPEGAAPYLVVHLQDITERREHEQILAEERRRLRAAEAIGRTGSWESDLAGEVVTCSDTVYELFGIEADTCRPRIAAALGCVHPEDRAVVVAAVTACGRTGAPLQARFRVVRSDDGELRWFDGRGEAVYEGGRRTQISGVIADITDQVLAERKLAESEARLQLAFETAPVGMAMVDLSGSSCRLMQVNPQMCAFTGRTRDELANFDLDVITHPDEVESNHVMINRLSCGLTQVVHVEKRFRDPDGSVVWGELAISLGSPVEGRPCYGIMLVEDISARKDAEQALVRQSLHDPLTGLANRTLLYDRIEHAVAASARSGLPVGVLFIDLDGFKQVNDTGGHAAGDQMLVEVARRLQGVVRPGDTVARMGGDEYAMVCVDVTNVDGLRAVALRALDALRSPFQLSVGPHEISASIGLALSDEFTTPEQILADADAAMYTAKRKGKNRISTPRLEQKALAARAAHLLPELHDAISDGQLVMFGQPVIDLTTGQTVAVETLIRWQHPHRGLLAPSDFLDVAEDGPLMIPLGQRALSESCRMAAIWTEHFGSDAADVHVNVSGRQLESGNLTGDVRDALRTYSLPPERLILELTETHMPVITDALRSDLNRLRDTGVRIAIDDLGTGHSSLTRITELPVDVLKIDLSFTAGLGRDPACDAVVRAVLGLGRAMGLSVIAEGVETSEQADLLRRYGCVSAQGYLYSPPRPEAELLRYITDHVAGAGTPSSPPDRVDYVT